MEGVCNERSEDIEASSMDEEGFQAGVDNEGSQAGVEEISDGSGMGVLSPDISDMMWGEL